MIDGEIYTMCRNTKVVFAYRDTGRLRDNTHYIGVNSYDEVKRYGDGHTIGEMGGGNTRPASTDEIDRFKSLLKQKDYYWNKTGIKRTKK